VGQTINGKYRVISKLGEGGFGVVYKVELLLFETGNIFALKILHPALSHDPSFRKRFLREAGLAMALIHEHTIQIREFGQTEDGQLFFTMDYSTGEPLKSVIAREGYLTVNRALLITRQVLLVLKHAHARGILHRDIKPENIFLEKDSLGRDFVKVGDFGLAKSFASSEAVGHSSPRGEPARARPPQPNVFPDDDITRGGIVGTPRYMSPEQALGKDDLDDRSDLYSLGVVLHEMLFGRVPAELAALEAGAAPPGKQAAPGHEVPEAVRAIVTRAAQPVRENRYRSADELLAALDALPRYAPTYVDVSRPPRRRFPAHFGVGLALAAGVLGTLLVKADWRWPWGRPIDASRTPALPSAPAMPGIRGFLTLAEGDVFHYLTFRNGIADRELTYTIEKQLEPGELLVNVEPGPRKVRWIVDEARGTFAQSFQIPDPISGAPGEPESRTLLQLPPGDAVLADPQSYTDAAGGLRLILQPVELKLPDDERLRFSSYVGCYVVESREENRQHYHYFQAGKGLVGIEVYESGPLGSDAKAKGGTPVYARYLIGIKKGQEPVPPASPPDH
jgi:serine/threonine protein kinase